MNQRRRFLTVAAGAVAAATQATSAAVCAGAPAQCPAPVKPPLMLQESTFNVPSRSGPLPPVKLPGSAVFLDAYILGGKLTVLSAHQYEHQPILPRNLIAAQPGDIVGAAYSYIATIARGQQTFAIFEAIEP